jgi:putative modified peptide
MNHEVLGKLMDRWTSDAQFRAAVRANPLQAIEQAGVELSDDEKAAVAAVDWTLSDQDLAARASHIMI